MLYGAHAGDGGWEHPVHGRNRAAQYAEAERGEHVVFKGPLKTRDPDRRLMLKHVVD